MELILEDLRKILNEKRNENNDAKNDYEVDSHGYNYFCGKVLCKTPIIMWISV